MSVVHVGVDRIDDINSLRMAVGWEPWAPAEASVVTSYLSTLGVLDGDRLIAWAGAVDHFHDELLLVDVMVAPDQRRRGLGAEVVIVTLRALRRQGGREVVSYTTAGLTPWFEQLGFRRDSGGQDTEVVRLIHQPKRE